MNSVKAISLDLDDTLWEIMPIIVRAEQKVHAFLADEYPRVTERFDIIAIREVRGDVLQRHPGIEYDFTEMRRLTYAAVLRQCEYDEADATSILQVFLDARHDLELFPDVLPALQILSEKFPLVSLSNGNADVVRLQLGDYFSHSVSARDVGVLKPHPKIFDAVCEHLRLDAKDVLHIGDHPVEDIKGAADYGMHTVWINRKEQDWEHDHEPHAQVQDLAELVELLA
ncbi:MAG: HAD family hydrolase [Gammaproteobacteria bacterium]|nr:HAD family hydrolase [Gammaproteobacteria bacterium]